MIRTTTISAIALTVAIIVLMVIFGTWYTVDQGDRGVFLRNGAVVGVSEPGLGFKLPFFEDVVHISVRSNVRTYEEMAAYSRDQQPAVMRVSVNYRLDASQVGDVYSTYGSEDGVLTRLLDPRVYEEVKTVFGQFNAVTSIQERARLNSEVGQAIATAASGPLIIEGVQIEQRMLAEVEVQKLRQNAEREKVQAEIVVTQANAQADSVRAAAEAEADRVRLAADANAHARRVSGEAEAIAIKVTNEARMGAIRENPLIVDYIQASNWNGVLPTTMIPGGTVPFLDVRPN